MDIIDPQANRNHTHSLPHRPPTTAARSGPALFARAGRWRRVEANWETSTLRRYSSLDDSLLTELIGEVAWSNEGLFALLQGLRRLSRIGGHRVNLPTIDWEIQP